MALEKVPMPERDPKERARCFEEVSTGYSPEQAVEEATRCLNCKAKPCVSGCPVGVPIPGFIAAVAAGARHHSVCLYLQHLGVHACGLAHRHGL